MKKIIIMTLIFLSICAILYAQEYSIHEIEIAKTIAMEACGEGFDGLYGIANVIANRSKQWNKTPYEVISQPNQFVGFTHKNRDKRFNECEEDSLYLAKHLLELKDITNGGLFFKRPEEKRQKWHKIKTITIKNHEFWK